MVLDMDCLIELLPNSGVQQHTTCEPSSASCRHGVDQDAYVEVCLATLLYQDGG